MPLFERESIPVFLGFDFEYHFDGFACYFFLIVSTQLPKGKRKKRKKRPKKRKKKTLAKKRKNRGVRKQEILCPKKNNREKGK